MRSPVPTALHLFQCVRWEDILSAKMLRVNVLLAIGSLASATPSIIGAGGLGLAAGQGVGGGVAG